ncbi:MAG: flavin reductase family protein [Streptosporangiales bacterium]|nr:flavin reductase family protein [Streptosporangiales bacterium]
MLIDPGALTEQELYKLLIGSVVPRPIAWVSTISAAGARNLAPFSFFTVVSRKPPMISLTIETHPDDREKDTFRNIADTREFVVNVVSTRNARQMHASSNEYPPDVDEFVAAGVSAASSSVVHPQRVADAMINMECRLHAVLTPGSDTVVVGTLVAYHVHDVLWHDGRIDQEKLDPLARIASSFAPLGDIFSLRHPTSPDSSVGSTTPGSDACG